MILGVLVLSIISTVARAVMSAEPTGCTGYVVTPPTGPTYLACEDPCESDICWVKAITVRIGRVEYPAFRCECFVSGGTRCCQVVGLKESDGSVTPKALGSCANAQSFCLTGNL